MVILGGHASVEPVNSSFRGNPYLITRLYSLKNKFTCVVHCESRMNFTLYFKFTFIFSLSESVNIHLQRLMSLLARKMISKILNKYLRSVVTWNNAQVSLCRIYCRTTTNWWFEFVQVIIPGHSSNDNDNKLEQCSFRACSFDRSVRKFWTFSKVLCTQHE